MTKNSSVLVGLSGGLGNQMFQYATGRSLAVRLGSSLALDVSWFSGQTKRTFALGNFCIDASTWRHSELLPGKLNALYSKFARVLAPKINGICVFREPHFHYCDEFDRINNPVFLLGYWQSEKYFKNIRPVLLKDFKLRELMPVACLTLVREIESCDSICIHVRRGDYVSDPVAAQTHGICALDYYRNGVQELIHGLENPHCFIFSDDPSWVRDSIQLDCATTVVDINGPKDAHLDLILMSSCKHFVIANSTLSWWAAWLGLYEHKCVVAPKGWFLSNDKDTSDLIPNGWLLR